MRNRLPFFLTLLLVWGGASVALAQSPYNIYFGDIHSQTWYSDGNKEQDTNTYRKPVAKAITYARDVAHNMNFLGVSDHNHRGSSDLHMNPGYWRAGLAEADSMNQDGVFVGMYGQEWGVINNGGHVLIYGTNKLFGWEPGNYDVYVSEYNYGMLFDSVKKYGGFCYFAHPQSTDYSGIFSNPFNPAWDSVVVGTAMKNGPALDAQYSENDPSSTDYTSRYHDLLRLGYHVAPCANQDNHYTNFGNLNQQRTAVLAASLTRANILEALRHRRTYATEDHNLQLRFEVGAHQMGEIFTASTPIPFRVKVVEPDGDAISTIELRYGAPGSGVAPTALASVAGQDSLVLSQPQTIGTTYYYYVYVRESNGREAWSAPMWITAAANSAPSVFSLFSPANVAANQETGGTLTWQASSFANQYDVYLGTDTSFSAPVSSNQTGTSYSYSGLSYNATYYWKVVAKNDLGQVTASGAPWTFSIHGPPPGAFSLVSPPNSATALTLSGSLSWNSSPNAATYDVYLGQANPPAVRVDSNLADTSVSYHALAPGTTYYWKTIARNPYGAVTASNAISSFTTANVPQSPSDAAADGATLSSIQFHWTDNASNESGYRIYRAFSAAGPFVEDGIDLPPNSTSFTDTGLQVNQRCYYRILPFNDQGEGNFAALDRATLAAPAGQPGISGASFISLVLTIDPGLNPPTTQYSINGGDSAQFFLQQDGSLGTNPVWQTSAGWGGVSGIQIGGLHQCRQYVFSVSARNGDSVAASSGPQAVQMLPCFSVARAVTGGWDIVSLPLGVSDGSTSSAFPLALSRAFSYEGGYVGHDSLRQKAGYWLKFDSSRVFTFAGDPDVVDSIPVVAGWNLVGSISVPVLVASIHPEPPNLLTSPFFGFNGMYVVEDSLRPIKGYWVKAKSSGNLILSSAAGDVPFAGNKPVAAAQAPASSFSFEDGTGHRQVLLIGEPDPGGAPVVSHELPPVPPPGAFDVRFLSQRSEEFLGDEKQSSTRYPVAIQSAGGQVRLSWHLQDGKNRTFRLLQGTTGVTLGIDGSTGLASGTSHIVLEVQDKSAQSVPAEFALYQNYPNPFNPSTSIQYDLPVESRVRLTVYNVLGVVVSELVHGVQPAGVHFAVWQPAQASGIYMYRIEASNIESSAVSFREVRRMVVIK